MTPDIPIALVGLGHRAIRGWIPLLLAVPGYRITGVCDLHPAHVAEAQKAIPYPVKVFADYADVLRDQDTEAIALTVRCKEQGAMAAAGIEAGKHVHAEVPAAHTIEDCERLIRAVQGSDRVYALAEQTRWWGFVDAWRDLVAKGDLGRPTLCEAQYFHHIPHDKFVDPTTGKFVGPDVLPEGAQPTWQHLMPPIHYLPHSLSPMLKVLDDRVVEVVAMGTRPQSYAHPHVAQSDMQMALMRTERDTLLKMATSFTQPHPHDEWHWYQVTGTRGRVEWRRAPQDAPKLWLEDGPSKTPVDMAWGMARDDAPAEAVGTGHGDADYYVHLAFRDAVRGERAPIFDVYGAVDTAAPAILAAESIRQGSQPLAVPDFRALGSGPRS